ncbi:MAG: PhzF family phenazine biosynthesis protein [Acidobacteriota bacterium]|nr:PhzF family phenazine biosynthesis protein [Acidobacteriota bacterium]
MKFHIVDVFAETRYSGNQLAVFVCPGAVPEKEMQAIAREINFSESAFILAENEEAGGWPVRIFTPLHEVDFAGHPTLGAAHVIQRELIRAAVPKLTLRLKVGPIPVEFSARKGDPLWMEQVAPIFGKTLPAGPLAELLGLPAEAIDESWPVQEVSTGLPHILVPLRSLEFLRRAKVDRGSYFRFIEKTWAKNILVFCLQGRTASHAVSVRMFADYLGIPEDPATGSGNGCLAGYLVRHRCLGTPSISLIAGQGHEIGRPSLLYLQADASGSAIHIRVGGKVMNIASGIWQSA